MKDNLLKAKGCFKGKDWEKSHGGKKKLLPQMKLNSIKKGFNNLWSNSLKEGGMMNP